MSRNPYSGHSDTDTPLFRTPAHTADPPTAKAAAIQAQPGKRAEMTLAGLLEWVDLWGEPPTAGELGRAMGVTRHVAARGLSDLKAAGKASHAGARICRATGVRLTTWDMVQP